MIMLNIDMLDAATAASNLVQSKTALERGCCGVLAWTMERLYMEAQDGVKTIAQPLFLNIFFYFLLV